MGRYELKADALLKYECMYGKVYEQDDLYYVVPYDNPERCWFLCTPRYQDALDTLTNFAEYWRERIGMRDDPKSLRCGGHQYMLGDEDDTKGFGRGFGGLKFKFRRLDNDEIIVTTNLWSNGMIPKPLRPLLPDNVVELPPED